MVHATRQPGQGHRAGLAAWVGLLALGAGGLGAQNLPPAVLQALERAKVPPQAVSVVIQDTSGARERLRWNAQQAMNPASVVKLVTTFAALDTLGPSWVWRTPVWMDGPIEVPGPDGVLHGNLHIKGSGDPKLTLERIGALLQRIRSLGIREIRGDIVLDQSAFALPATSAGEFDGERLRPYNVQARALMLNQRSVIYTFMPDTARGVARVVAEPALHGVAVEATVALGKGPCEDWRGQLKAQFTEQRVRWTGRYPASCAQQQWPVAHPDPEGYDARLLQALWASLGGRMAGTVREGPAPSKAASFEWASPPLSDVVRDINRFSNNTMAQMLALSWTGEMAIASGSAATTERNGITAEQARDALQQWAQTRLSGPGLRLENGSGLSREQRLTAEQVATLLRLAWMSPVMPDLMASLPVAGAPDGTLRRLQQATGRAHLKTGSLRDVAAVAGYALGRSGQRWIVVVMIHHEQAQAARPALEALVQWAIQDEPPRPVVRTNPRSAPP